MSNRRRHSPEQNVRKLAEGQKLLAGLSYSRCKIRDGQVANRPVYAAIGVTVDGKRDILGLCVSDH